MVLVGWVERELTKRPRSEDDSQSLFYGEL